MGYEIDALAVGSFRLGDFGVRPLKLLVLFDVLLIPFYVVA